MSSTDDFFSGGLPSAKFDKQGKVVGGRITRVGDPMQQRDLATGELKWWDAEKTQPMMQLPIDVQTDERDSEIPGDTGARSLYVKGDMKRAITEALRKAGVQGAPKVGGTLEVAWTSSKPAKVRGFNDTKLYTARYTPPAAGDAFFGSDAGRQAEQAAKAQGDPFAASPTPQPAAPAMASTAPAASGNPFGDEPPF